MSVQFTFSVESIPKIEAAAKRAAEANKTLNEACPYPFGSTAGFVFKTAFNQAKVNLAH